MTHAQKQRPYGTPSRQENILNEILTSKRKEVMDFKLGLGANLPEPLPSTKSFRDALSGKGSRFIFEYKKASPSRGLIRPNANIEMIAEIYDAKADCISVLTDASFFGGSFNDLSDMRRLTTKPLLAKDFFIEDIQVTNARLHGADAILLMLSALDDETYLHLRAKAKTYNMDVLTEVHDENELTRAIYLEAEIIGINNRNLRDLIVSLETTRHLSPKIPKRCLVVSESGYLNRNDIRENAKYSDAFLIGSAVMANADPETKINELTLDQVKVCGLTRREDAKIAADLGARYGGLIFAPHSPRCLTIEHAKKIIQENRLDYVGVFLNAPLIEIGEMAYALKLEAVQLHGDETAEYRANLKKLLPKGCKIIQAYQVDNIIPFDFPEHTDFILFDTYSKGVAGGTGKSFNWEVLKQKPYLDKAFLAGGLSPKNATKAVNEGTYALDVNSQIEEAPGVKCPIKMTAFFENLKKATPSRAEMLLKTGDLL